MKDQWKTSVGNHATNRTQHSEDASPETQSKSYDQGKQPFLRSKNPIQVNLFGEQHTSGKKWGGNPVRENNWVYVIIQFVDNLSEHQKYIKLFNIYFFPYSKVFKIYKYFNLIF